MEQVSRIYQWGGGGTKGLTIPPSSVADESVEKGGAALNEVCLDREEQEIGELERKGKGRAQSRRGTPSAPNLGPCS